MKAIRIGMMYALLSVSLAAASGPPREHFEHATVIYDWVSNARGEKLRTFITHPANSTKPVPAIFFVGWLSCDSMEYPDTAPGDGFGIFLHRLIDESGFATVRMDKLGVGESQGECAKADFQSEMEGWQAAFQAMSRYDFIDLDRVFVIGLSNGGGFSPLVAGTHPVRGFISCGSWGRTWYEHMLELERRRLEAEGKSSEEVNAAIKAFSEFYILYLVKGMTPAQILAEHPEWKDLWYDAPDGQYGRPASFYQQLQALNLGKIWQETHAPVLVIRGSNDEVMSRADGEAITNIVNHERPGTARYMEIEGMAHGMTVNGRFPDEIFTTTLNWLNSQLAPK
jgi:pimeloyl-ACP methyl ester carboxylesterase